MSFLRTGSDASFKPRFTGLQVQTSINTLPIPVVWGRTRIAPNVIWYNNFKQRSSKQKVGGKGMGGGSSTTYYYSCDIIMGICEGPVYSIGQVWQGTTIFEGLSGLYLSLFTGATPQADWGYLFSKYPSQALTYPGIAFVCAANYDLGTSASLPNHNYEVLTPLAGSGANGVDADPVPVIDDFLFNQQYGVRMPAGSVNTATLYSSAEATTTGDAALQTYCRAVGICFSPCLTNVETAQSVLQRWIKLLNCAVVDSAGVMQFIPFGDEVITANGVTFKPNVTPIFNLGDDDFQGDSAKDPVQGQITDVTEAYNVERLTIRDRADAYNSLPIEARDEAMVNLHWLRVDTGISADEICDANVGAIVAQLILQRQLYVRNTHVIKLDERYCGLDPMDVITLTDANMGMDNTAVRIMQIEEDNKGILTVTVEELPAGVGTAATYAKQGSSSGANFNFATANPVNPPVIFEPPPALTGGTAEVWIAACGSVGGVADPLWGGAEVYISLDNSTYQYIGSVDAPARQGALMAALPAYSGANPEPTTYQYWRFVCAANTNGNQNTDLAEIQFYDGSGARYYPSGGTASGTYTSGQVPANAFDNNLSTFWEDYVGSGGATGYVQYEFSAPVGFSRIDFFCRESTLGGPSSIIVEVSNDGVTFTPVGTLTATSWAAGVAKSLYVAVGGTLNVDLTMSGGVLSNAASAASAAAGNTMCYVDGEIISFVTATLTGAEQYELTTLYRGQYGTAPLAHAQGAQFCRLDSAVFTYPLPAEYIGQVLFVKLASFNGQGGGLQSLADCTAFIYSPTGSGAFGPIANALSLGLSLDYGLVTDAVTISDDFGAVIDTVNLPIDLGTI